MKNMEYSAKDNLEVLKNAKNYNNFLASEILNVINKYNCKNVLDFGCYDGFFIEEIKRRKNLNFFGVEIDSNSIKVCHEKGLCVFDEVEKINSEIDFIYTLNVLEHVEDDVSVIQKLKNKLAKNGKILIYVPAFPFLFSSMDKHANHFRRYTKNGLISKIVLCGFKIDKVEYCDSLGVLATLCYKLKDLIKTSNGIIGHNQVKIYDSIFFLSRLLDKILFSRFFGKNLLVVASID